MANEATVTCSLQVRKADVTDATKVLIDYQSRPSQFRANVAGNFGPYSPVILAALGGTTVSLVSLGTQPGLIRVSNQGSNGVDSPGDAALSNWVEYGTYDTHTGLYSTFGKMYVGESYVLRLSQNFGREYSGPGTGSAGSDLLFFKSIRTQQQVLLEVFPI